MGRAASDAFHRSVHPFLRERLPLLAGPGQPVPEPLPQRGSDPAALGLLIAAAVGVPLGEALQVLPFLHDLVRAAHGEPGHDLADRLGMLAEDVFLLEVEPFVSEHEIRIDIPTSG